MVLSLQEWATLVLSGGLFGMVGQGIRVVVGLKKVHDNALNGGENFKKEFDASTLLLSLLIGFVAGALGSLGLSLSRKDFGQIGMNDVVTLIGIGYAGADFIEGFMRQHMPATATPTPVTAPPASVPDPALKGKG
ncbi:MAG: hypothetical protein QG656_1126 [Candidatus Hydrogenedentes bacterium]|nr:hypothetical protein [Candidatus Hydrogenedentota bacterium]